MIRFCDREIYCVEYCRSLSECAANREDLLEYFLNGHQNDVVSVCDNNTGRFIGVITFQALNCSSTILEAIRTDYLIWDSNIWRNARTYFRRHQEYGTEYLIPILDKDYHLFCFAYEDLNADREIRMLRELTELPDALQFTDIYPKYKCVRIYEFNELAYLFANYLEKLGVLVEVSGEMWQGFFNGKEGIVHDHERFEIFAEGINEGEHSWTDNLLRSASVEFECIDRIYEANIKCGNIRDGNGDFVWLADKIRNEKEIVIIGTGMYSLNTYDLLYKNGIDIFCFMSEDQRDWNRKLFGKCILKREKIISSTKKPIFLECRFANSSWGGEVDRYDYEGFRRNVQYFLLRDYVEITIGKLQNILKGKNVILVGNANMCNNVIRVLEDVACKSIIYCDLLGDRSIENNITIKGLNRDCTKNIVALIIEPQYLCDTDYSSQMKERKKLYYETLERLGIYDISQYYSESEVLVSIQAEHGEKYSIPCLTPNSILLNVSGHMSGNEFFGNLLDGHPDVLQMDWGIESIRSNMFLVCIQLAEETGEDILRVFWEIYDAITLYDAKIFSCRKDRFNEKFMELLAYKDSFTSQELFVLIHIAYAKAWNQEISCINDIVIYYEQRKEIGIRRPIYEKWLADEKIKGFSINITRNAYARVGSLFKLLQQSQIFFYPKIGTMWNHMAYSKEHNTSHNSWKRIVVKFEAIKLFPQETLAGICNELKISWNDKLLLTSFHGKISEYQSGKESISNFDLRPVFNLYEEYFSGFDRLRLNMIFSKEQKEFGYPYVSCSEFSRRQIQEMFLKEFQFESKLSYENEYWRNNYRKDFMIKVNEYLQAVRMKEILKENGENISNNGQSVY